MAGYVQPQMYDRVRAILRQTCVTGLRSLRHPRRQISTLSAVWARAEGEESDEAESMEEEDEEAEEEEEEEEEEVEEKVPEEKPKRSKKEAALKKLGWG